MISFDDIKYLLDLNKSEASYPALTQIIESVESAIKNYCMREFEFDSYTESNVFGFGEIFVRAYPIKKIKKIVIDDHEVTSFRFSNGTVKITDYKYQSGYATISYNGGFDDIPSDIKRACILQICHEYQRRDAIGATSVTSDGGSISYPSLGLLSEVKRLLNPYRNFNLGGY